MTLEAIILALIILAAAAYILYRYVWRRKSCCDKKPKAKRTTLTIGGKSVR